MQYIHDSHDDVSDQGTDDKGVRLQELKHDYKTEYCLLDQQEV